MSSLVIGLAQPASAGTTANRVDLRVLVLSDGGSNVTAIATELGREGVPTTVVDLTSSSRPTINDSYLENAATHEGYFQGIVMTSETSVSADELSAISNYERVYGVRQIDAYVYPGATYGTNAATYSGTLDGSSVAVTDAAKADGFGYLTGSLTVDNFSPTVDESYGYLATALDPEPAGETYTPLLTATSGSNSGSIVGVNTVSGRSQLVVSIAFNGNQQYFLEIGHGIISWLTRGIHLGYQRNYFAVQVDDVFLADSQWDAAGHCTPGDDCFGANAGLKTPDIRMTPQNVTDAVNWQNANNFKLDMIFNGGGSDDVTGADNTPPSRPLADDPLEDAYQAAATNFEWINHTYSHEYLGCIQVAPTVAGQLWHCARAADYADQSTVFIDPTVANNPAAVTYDAASDVYYMSTAEIESQISKNIAWAAAHGISTDASQIVTGEHSGLAIQPEQPVDNPNLAPALTAEGISVMAADASRESNSRQVGPATTVPRHPMNIFYNVNTMKNEVDEYNWYYTSVSDGGSGVCTNQPTITTCIQPLPNTTDTETAASFNGYIVPTETQHALAFALANDPRPFYVHQSNLSGEQILYPVLNSILSAYRSVYNDSTTPFVHLDLKGQAQALTQMANWKTSESKVTAYLDSSGVHVNGGGSSASIPVTVPADAGLNGVTLDGYGGEKSGWIAPPASDTVIATPGTTMGGYIGVPDAPAIGTATAGNNSATVTWTAPNDHGSPVTGYTVYGYLAGAATPSVTATAAASANSLTVSGLLNYASYTFAVSATSAAGDSALSAQTNAVIPGPSVPGAPIIGTATPGNTSASVTWSPPASDGGSAITTYTVRIYADGSTTPLSSQDVTPPTTTAIFTGLTNGTSYTFDVFAYNAAGSGPASGLSNSVTPAGAPGSPTIGTVTAGNASATVTWTAPASTGGGPITGYTVEVYAGAATTPTTTKIAAASATSLAVTGLTNGTSYTFDVIAVNAAGPSAPSAKSAAVTPGVPGAPTIGSVTAGRASATVRWTAPASVGASRITKYTVEAYAGGATTPTLTKDAGAFATSTSVTGLTNGTSYTFDVIAVNASGPSLPSAQSAAVIPLGVPGAPSITSAVAGNKSAVVTWAAPASDGGSAITSYRIRAYMGALQVRSVTIAATATTGTVTNLVNGIAYTFDVVAINALGAGTASARSSSVTPVGTVPLAPGIGTARTGAAGGALTATAVWTMPSDNGGYVVTGYVVTASQVDATGQVLATIVSPTQSMFTRSLSMTLPAGNYNFTVHATNAAGVSPESAVSNTVAAR